jgi:hypothetical protein
MSTCQAERHNGEEIVSVKDKQEARLLFGRLLRILDKAGLSSTIDAELRTILKAIQEA